MTLVIEHTDVPQKVLVEHYNDRDTIHVHIGIRPLHPSGHRSNPAPTREPAMSSYWKTCRGNSPQGSEDPSSYASPYYCKALTKNVAICARVTGSSGQYDSGVAVQPTVIPAPNTPSTAGAYGDDIGTSTNNPTGDSIAVIPTNALVKNHAISALLTISSGRKLPSG